MEATSKVSSELELFTPRDRDKEYNELVNRIQGRSYEKRPVIDYARFILVCNAYPGL